MVNKLFFSLNQMRKVDNRCQELTVLIYKYCELALMQKKVKSKVQLASCDTIFYVAASSLHQFSRLDLVDQKFQTFHCLNLNQKHFGILLFCLVILSTINLGIQFQFETTCISYNGKLNRFFFTCQMARVQNSSKLPVFQRKKMAVHFVKCI